VDKGHDHSEHTLDLMLMKISRCLRMMVDAMRSWGEDVFGAALACIDSSNADADAVFSQSIESIEQ
jgi:hypothetical protein